jgi:NDP-sugar pyrophosphorylase family protein
MQAIILAGGRGTRLKPYTTVFPKPLMPIGETPILEIVIRQLHHFGFNEVSFSVGYLKELLMAFFGDGARWDVQIKYSAEEYPLGTAGPLKLIKTTADNILVLNGDVLSDINYREFFEYHIRKKAICTIATFPKPVKIDLGTVKKDDSGHIIDYVEKPTLHYDVSMGIYAFSRSALDFIPDKQYYDIPTLILNLLSLGYKIQSYPFDGLWLDIGRQEDYEKAIETFELNRNKFLP